MMRRSSIRDAVIFFFAGLALAARGNYERREADALALGLGAAPPPVFVPNRIFDSGAKNNALANGTPQTPQPTIRVNPGNQPGAAQAAPNPQQVGNPMQGAQLQGAQQAQGLANGAAQAPAAPAVTINPGAQQAVAGTATLVPLAAGQQGNGNAGGVIGTVTITTGVNGNGGNQAAAATPNAADGLRTVTISPAAQGQQGQQGNGLANGGNGKPATVTINPAGQANQGQGAANNPVPNAGNMGNAASVITIVPAGAAATPGAAGTPQGVAGAPQGVAGAQGANACQCMCACPAGAFGGVAGMPGIMGPMDPAPAPAVQPTTLATSASIPPAAPPAADPNAAPQGQQAQQAPQPPAAVATPPPGGAAPLAAMAPGSQVTVSGGEVLPLQSSVTVPLLGKMFHIGPVEGAEEMWM